MERYVSLREMYMDDKMHIQIYSRCMTPEVAENGGRLGNRPDVIEQPKGENVMTFRDATETLKEKWHPPKDECRSRRAHTKSPKYLCDVNFPRGGDAATAFAFAPSYCFDVVLSS
ncbi:hypothetical protein PV325_003030 [Microctonus aethiopoides]|nr:hypothetical protein PV325_003030 [Microctonus aethiopoides]